MGANNTTNKEKLNRWIIAANLKRIVYSCLLLSMSMLIIFLLSLLLPGERSGNNLFIGFFIGFELFLAAFLFLSLYVHQEKDYALGKLVSKSYWMFLQLFFFGYTCMNFQEYGSLLAFIFLVAVINLVPIFDLIEITIYSTIQVIFLLIISIWLKITPILIVEAIFILLFLFGVSRVAYKMQINTLLTKKKDLKPAPTRETGRDPLTGLLSRRGLEDKLDAQLPDSIQKKCLVALLLVDIDDFKQYNIVNGEKKGDNCLQKIALELQNSIGQAQGIAARFDGEEFLVFMNPVNEKIPIMLSEHIRKNIEGLQIIRNVNGLEEYMTVSVGISMAVLQKPEDFHALYLSSKKSLGAAKQSGKNCVAYGTRVYGKKRAQSQ